MSKKELSPLSYLRFFHALPVKFNIDIFVDQKLVFRDIMYEDFTDYIKITPGEHTIHITQTKSPMTIYSLVWRIPAEKIYTALIAPQTKDSIGIEIYKIEDIQRVIPSNHFLIRSGHFSMNRPSIDTSLSENAPVFKRVGSSEVTNYISLEPNLYNLQVSDSQTGKLLIKLPRIRLKTSRCYSIYMIGNGTKEFPLTAALSLDGNSYLKI